MTVDNADPQVSITAPVTGQEVFVSGTNPVLDAAVTYADNVDVVRVVYYLDNVPVTTAVEAPFTASLVLESLGEHSLWAEAFDAAGNSALSDRITFVVRRGS